MQPCKQSLLLLRVVLVYSLHPVYTPLIHTEDLYSLVTNRVVEMVANMFIDLDQQVQVSAFQTFSTIVKLQKGEVNMLG